MPLDEEIRERVASYGFGPQLDALPSAESMTWVPHSAGNPAFGLTIARSEGRQILAYLTRYGEKPLEVRYCTRTFDKPGHKSPTLITTITQDEVMKVPLEAPFKYLAENTKPMKRKFSMLIRWYFLSHGLIDSLEGDMDDFSKRFGAAVRRIEDAKHDEQEGTQHRTRRHRETIEESPEPEDEENAYGLRSGGRTCSSNLLNSERESPQNTLPRSPPVLRSVKENTDLRRLREYLDCHDTLYLLENIPEADEMQFVDQTLHSDAQPKKLFMGSEAKSGDDIYAYMVSLPRGFHEVRFYVQHTQRDGQMKTETVTKQRLVHPFSKCFPKPPTSVEQSDRARLTLMVKYYFIAAGIVTDCILHETKKFPERLRVALDYIAERMGPAAVKPPSNDTTTEDTTLPSDLLPTKRLSSESSYVDESDIQSTLAGEPTPRAATRHKSSLSACSTSSTRKPTTSSTVLLPSSSEPTPLIDSNLNPSFPPITSVPHHSHSNSHSTTYDVSLKRSAEDAEFEDLARIIMKEQNLTKEINSLQHDLDVLEERKRMWLEKWDKEFEALSSKKDGVVEERTKVRKVFKRQRLSSQGEDE